MTLPGRLTFSAGIKEFKLINMKVTLAVARVTVIILCSNVKYNNNN